MKRIITKILLYLLFALFAIWGTVSYFGKQYFPDVTGAENAMKQAKVDAERAFQNNVATIWDKHYKKGLPLKEVSRQIAEEDNLRQAREIIAGSHGQIPLPADTQAVNNQTSSKPKTWDWMPPLAAGTEETEGNYLVTVNPEIEWQDSNIPLEGKNNLRIESASDDKMCSPPEPCVGPEGLTKAGFARFETIRPTEYIYGDAVYHELIGRFDNGQPFRIGNSANISIPPGAKTLKVMANIRKPYLNEAGGGWKVIVTTQ